MLHNIYFLISLNLYRVSRNYKEEIKAISLSKLKTLSYFKLKFWKLNAYLNLGFNILFQSRRLHLQKSASETQGTKISVYFKLRLFQSMF